MKRDVWKPCSAQRWQMELQFWILRFFELSDLVNNHLLCYRQTIHLAISKICPKFQVISSHFFEVNELLNEHWAKIVLSEDISTHIYVKCYEMYRSKVCVQEFSYIMSGLDIQLEKSDYVSPVCKKISCRWRNRTSHVLFFPSIMIWYEPMAEWLRWLAESLPTWVQFLMSAEMVCSTLATLRGTKPVCTLTRALFILLRSL